MMKMLSNNKILIKMKETIKTSVINKINTTKIEESNSSYENLFLLPILNFLWQKKEKKKSLSTFNQTLWVFIMQKSVSRWRGLAPTYVALNNDLEIFRIIKLTCPPVLPLPYCLPSTKPASQSVLIILSSSFVPFTYLIASSASSLV